MPEGLHMLLVDLHWHGDCLWTPGTTSLGLEVGFQFRQAGSAGGKNQPCFLLLLVLPRCQLQSDNINGCWQSLSIFQHFLSVWESSQVLSQSSEKESCCRRCGFHKAMDDSSHISTLAFTRSFPAVVQGSGTISVALQLLTEPPVPGTWEETVAVSKTGTSVPALPVHAAVCACPGGLPTFCASRAVGSCHTGSVWPGCAPAMPTQKREAFVCWLCVKPPYSPVLQ